ncbi:MAG: copper amine oxidase domain protein, partial [Paenibacillaceae bacterium]|nr:copper amine oxidase domain protein [Paenibacillaceae bacterium]
MQGYGKAWYGKAFILAAIFSMLVLPQAALAETESTANDRVKIVDFSKEMKDGQLVVTAKVENGAVPGGAGMVVVGYDGEGNPIETGSNGGSMSNRETRKLSVTLHAGESIKEVKVFPAGNGPKDRTIVLSQGVRKVEGELIVTGVVEVGSNELQNSGIAAVGFNRLGKTVAMDIAQSMEGYNGGHWAQTYEIKLPGDVGIEQVKLFPVGDVREGVSLLSHMESPFGEKIFVTGVVENGNKEAYAASNASNAPVNPFINLYPNVGTSTGIAAIGYNSQGQVVDIQTESAKILRHTARVFSLTLNSASQIEDVKVFAIGEYARSNIQLGFTTTNKAGELEIDGAVGNDGNAAYQVGLIAVGYDDQDQMVEVNGARYLIEQSKVKPFKVVMQSAEQIHDVRVMIEDSSTLNERIPYAAARETDGKTVVTAVLKGSNAYQAVDVLAVGYDWQGKEVASERSSTPVSSQEMKTI